MSKNLEAINHILENFKQLIHDFCEMEDPKLGINMAEFNHCISAVERSCDLAYNIVRKAYKQAEADAGFKEPEISKKYYTGFQGFVFDPCKFRKGIKIGSAVCAKCSHSKGYNASEKWVKCEKYHNEIKPRVIKGTKAQVREAIDSDPNLEYAKDKLTAIDECFERR